MDKSSRAKRVILAVDDMGLNLRTVKLSLEDAFEVRLAKSGEMALSIAGSQQIDLILLDIEMPSMSGFDFMIKLNESYKNNPHVGMPPPVIFVTAHATPELLVRAKISGAVGYVLKPFDPDILRKKVTEALGMPPLASTKKE